MPNRDGGSAVRSVGWRTNRDRGVGGSPGVGMRAQVMFCSLSTGLAGFAPFSSSTLFSLCVGCPALREEERESGWVSDCHAKGLVHPWSRRSRRRELTTLGAMTLNIWGKNAGYDGPGLKYPQATDTVSGCARVLSTVQTN